MFALFHNGKQFSKAHSTRIAAMTEAFERGVVISWGADFCGDKPGISLCEGFSVKAVEPAASAASNGEG